VPGAAETPVPALLTLVDAEASPGEVRLEWFAGGTAGPAMVERRTSGSDWALRGEARALGQGSYTFVDRAEPGRYAYRLRLGNDVSAEAWLDVPGGAGLALAGFRPNPASNLRTVAFTLASGSPATLSLVDVRGRTIVRRDVGALGPGPHAVDLGAAVPAGVYFLRLVQDGTVREARGVVTRGARIE
jgi:hypothetical protein